MTQKFNINTLIQKGKELVFEYELPVGTVYYRPLTDLEMDEAESYMITVITDPVTMKYVMNIGDEGTKSEDKSKDESEEADNDDLYTQTKGVNFVQIAKANAAVANNIVLMAIRDFTDGDVTIEDISKLSGIKNLADEVKRVSGYDTEVIAKVEDFRKDE